MRNIKWEVILKILKVNSKAAVRDRLREEMKDGNKKVFKPDNYNQTKKTHSYK